MERVLSRRRGYRLPELPKLTGRLGDRSSINSESVLCLLRQTALKNRRDCLQPFYSIRAVAEHFHIPPATVSRIYRRLSGEGLLRLMWGSRTFLEPAESSKKKQYIVGIPVDLNRFTSSSEYRRHVLEVQSAIWCHGVAEHLIFFQDADEVVCTVRRQYSRRINTVIWLFPKHEHGNTLLRLYDMGIHFVCLGGGPIPGVRHCYSISGPGHLGRIVRKRILKLV